MVLERNKNGNPKETQKPISHIAEVVVYVALQIGLEHEEILSTTPQHPFYVTKRSSGHALEKRNLSKALENLSDKWIPASDLEIGDTVLTSSRMKRWSGFYGVV